MTINVALVTSEAIVFGCDSTTSSTSHMLNVFPFLDGTAEDGKLVAKFNFTDISPVVTNAWSGVTKMFQIGDHNIPVAAVTAGTAKLSDRTMASLALEFAHSGKAFKSVKDCANEFLQFMRKHYDEHYASSPIPEPFRDGPEFLVGGYGRTAKFPALFSVKIKENTVDKEFDRGKTGVSWNGQADAVERVIRGIDGRFLRTIGSYITKRHRIIEQLANIENVQLPDGLNLSEVLNEDISLGGYGMDVDYSNLPLQEAINMVAYLVLMQAGKARFEKGIATVGGRIHVAVITKDRGFQLLNEPNLTHKYTGFFDET